MIHVSIHRLIRGTALAIALALAPAANAGQDGAASATRTAADAAAADAAPADAAATDAAAADDGASAERLAAGRTLFLEGTSPSCSVCHTLADAETTGQIGPDLDELMPTAERVRAAVTQGVGIMPSFGGQLTADEIDTIAAYVSTVAGGS